MASGIFVLPLEKELIKPAEEGIKNPTAMPVPIATKIHRVRKRSKKLSCFLSLTGAQLLADIIQYKIRGN